MLPHHNSSDSREHEQHNHQPQQRHQQCYTLPLPQAHTRSHPYQPASHLHQQTAGSSPSPRNLLRFLLSPEPPVTRETASSKNSPGDSDAATLAAAQGSLPPAGALLGYRAESVEQPISTPASAPASGFVSLPQRHKPSAATGGRGTATAPGQPPTKATDGNTNLRTNAETMATPCAAQRTGTGENMTTEMRKSTTTLRTATEIGTATTASATEVVPTMTTTTTSNPTKGAATGLTEMAGERTTLVPLRETSSSTAAAVIPTQGPYHVTPTAPSPSTGAKAAGTGPAAAGPAAAKIAEAATRLEEERILERNRKGRERSLRTRRRNAVRLHLLEANVQYLSRENSALRDLLSVLGAAALDVQRIVAAVQVVLSARAVRPLPYSASVTRMLAARMGASVPIGRNGTDGAGSADSVGATANADGNGAQGRSSSAVGAPSPIPASALSDDGIGDVGAGMTSINENGNDEDDEDENNYNSSGGSVAKGNQQDAAVEKMKMKIDHIIEFHQEKGVEEDEEGGTLDDTKGMKKRKRGRKRSITKAGLKTGAATAGVGGGGSGAGGIAEDAKAIVQAAWMSQSRSRSEEGCPIVAAAEVAASEAAATRAAVAAASAAGMGIESRERSTGTERYQIQKHSDRQPWEDVTVVKDEDDLSHDEWGHTNTPQAGATQSTAAAGTMSTASSMAQDTHPQEEIVVAGAIDEVVGAEMGRTTATLVGTEDFGVSLEELRGLPKLELDELDSLLRF